MDSRRAWNVAVILRLCVAAVLVAVPWALGWGSAARPWYAWAAVTVASSIALRVASPSRVRDWVDVRLPLEAAVVGAVLAW